MEESDRQMYHWQWHMSGSCTGLTDELVSGVDARQQSEVTVGSVLINA